MARYIGIDYGRARIGVAVSDPMEIIASPIATVKATKDMQQTIQEILNHIKDYEPIEAFVLGLPLLFSGKDSEMTTEVRKFAALLEEITGKKVILWDERLTSTQVDRALKEQSLKRKKRAQVIDKLAATLILQNYLDFKGNIP